MGRVLLIAMIAGCSAPPRPPPAPAPEPAGPPAETLWDSGTFVTVERDYVLPGIDEKFEIYRTADGYRFTVIWHRPAPTGDPSEGEVELFTDRRFSPLAGKMVTRIRAASGTELTRSTIQREPDGRLVTEVIYPDGKKENAQSTGPNDWFIGGTLTTFLVALCQAATEITQPKVYPDKVTVLDPAQPLPIDGTSRAVTSRTLTYQQSGRRVTVACEDGKLAGEVARGITVVRTGDLPLARALEQAFR